MGIAIVLMCWENELGRTQIKYTIKATRILREKFKSEKSRSHTQIHYIIKEIKGEEERTSQLFWIYNGICILTLMTVHPLL